MHDEISPSSHTPSQASSQAHVDAPQVVRKRSTHRRHHRGHSHHHSASEETLRNRQNRKLILFAIPLFAIAIGGVLLSSSYANPDPSMRNHKTIQLGWEMLGGGLLFYFLALVYDWSRRLKKHFAEQRELHEIAHQIGRRRSSHHRHRHHRS